MPAALPDVFSTSGKIAPRRSRSVLLVEDEPSARMAIEQQLKGLGYETLTAGDAQSARDLLAAMPHAVDVIVLDGSLPDDGGMRLARHVRKDHALSAKPIVLLSEDRDALCGGGGLNPDVQYHLRKPADPAILQSVVATAFRHAETIATLSARIDGDRSAMALVSAAKWQFRTPRHARDLAVLLAGAFPVPERAVVGLLELMLNAIEHGNLAIGHQRKRELVEAEAFDDEVERRLALPEYKGRTATTTLKREDNGLHVIITDEGAGFRPQPFLSHDPGRGASRCGRGIARARSISFDRLGYNAAGNQVVGFVSIADGLDW